LCRALLQLVACSDEASTSVGIPPLVDRFDEFGSIRLFGGDPPGSPSTLCSDLIHPSKLRVLPKLHTPESGLTIRSLSHNLALLFGGEVEPVWVQGLFREDADALNILVVPWPELLAQRQFRSAPAERLKHSALPREFGLFRYAPEIDRRAGVRFASLLSRASLVGNIDMVVFPELALTPREHDAVRSVLIDKAPDALLIAGIIGEPERPERAGRNYVAVTVPSGEGLYISFNQDKHHRWRVDRSQIAQYGLGGHLSPARRWWEDADMGERKVFFVAHSPWLTMATLLCEDLARQDPVGNVIRSVGPNLVVALLMDGPQIPDRWPNRYATVLADDPGCSVLTVTSAGMMTLSRPPEGRPSARTVALWKDARDKRARPIDLPLDAEAVVLSLAGDYYEEFTADGRRDGVTSGYPVLADTHVIPRARSR
jgi:hypothetical protein